MVRHTVCCADCTLFKLLDIPDGTCKGSRSEKKKAGGLGPYRERRHSDGLGSKPKIERGRRCKLLSGDSGTREDILYIP